MPMPLFRARRPAGPVTVAAAGATITDSFNRANSAVTLGTTDTGQMWTAHAGTWGISSNQAYCVVDASGVNFATVPAAADGTLQFTIPVTGGGSGGSPWGAFRFTDIDNTLYVQGNGIEALALRKREGAAASTLATGTIPNLSANDVVKVVLAGSSIKIYVNDVLDIDTTSAFNQSATRVGLGTDFGAGPGAAPRFDAFSFTP